MITKTAVTAWKLMMPYLGEDAQQLLIKNVRKPMAEYNTAVANGSRNIAKKYDIDMDTMSDTKNKAVQFLQKNPHTANTTAYDPNVYLHKLPIAPMDRNNRYGLALKRKGLVKYRGKLVSTAKRDAYKKDYDALREKLLSKPRTIINIAPSQGGAKEDYIHNLITRHELSEGSNFEKYYKRLPDKKLQAKRGVNLASPNTEEHPMSHISLDVLKDELKGGLRSGYPEMLVRDDLSFRPVSARFMNGEMEHVLKAGNKGMHDTSDLFAPDMSILGNLYKESHPYKGSINTSDVRNMQKKFFNNLHKDQRKHNVKVKAPISPQEFGSNNYVVGD